MKASKVINSITSEKKTIKEIFFRIIKRDFSGTSGLMIKNSVFQLSTSFVAKIGALIFTVIIARLLTPELFGLYSLALSTLLIFAAFSELGISQAIIRFISREFGKKKENVESYLLYIGKIKVILLFSSAILLLALANFLSNEFYKKPLFLALFVGVLYLIFTQIVGFFQSVLQALNNFKIIFKGEIISQISKNILVPTAILLSIKYSLSNGVKLMMVILFLAISLLLVSLFLFFNIKRIYVQGHKKDKINKLSKNQKKEVNNFILATAALAFSGAFFSYIDRIMLGLFVKAEFIGYYSAAFNLIGALAPLVGFAAVVLLPLFSRMVGKKIEILLNKSLKLTALLSIVIILAVVLISKLAILIIYGTEYSPATNILRLLSIMLVLHPLISIYSSYFLSKGHPGIVAKGLVLSIIINIALNYLLLTFLIKYGDLIAVYGVVATTLVSQLIYLGVLTFMRRNKYSLVK